VLGLQVRENDADTYAWVRKLNNPSVEHQIYVEREVLKNMEGGCQLPLGVYNDGEMVHVAYGTSKYQAAQLYTFTLVNAQETALRIVDTLKNL
jgi:hydroxymethylbilane synthase